MSKLDEARKLLELIEMPAKQQSDICCYTILAMANLSENKRWNEASNEWIRIHDIIQFVRNEYGVKYAENSRETFRKQAIHHFRNAALIEDNGLSTNSPNYRYRFTGETLDLLKTYNSTKWETDLKKYKQAHVSLKELYKSKKKMLKMDVKINSEDFTFSPGKHNELQKAIIEEFAPRFAPDSECLYVGDTIKKDLVKNTEVLEEIGFSITQHDKMPDVVLYNRDKNWLYFIESVTSVGPIDPKRMVEINEMIENVSAGIIYVTAFQTMKVFKKFAEELAWETEVWISDMPEHMIHLNGDRFMGPRG